MIPLVRGPVHHAPRECESHVGARRPSRAHLRGREPHQGAQTRFRSIGTAKCSRDLILQPTFG
jgi:hypothetical protein